MSNSRKKSLIGKLLFILGLLIAGVWFSYNYYQNNIADDCSTISYKRSLPVPIKRVNEFLKQEQAKW